MQNKTYNKTYKVKDVYETAKETILQYCCGMKSRAKKYRKPYLILLIIHIVGILAILQADVYYADDISRVAWGYRNFSSTFGRWISEYLSVFLHTSKSIADISPLTQLLAATICAASALILIRVIAGGGKVFQKVLFRSYSIGAIPLFFAIFVL